MSVPLDVLGWSTKQGHILVGGGLLNQRQQPGRDFDEEELPHYLLRNGVCMEVFQQWRLKNLRGDISGAWNRPLFAGGWKESTDKDTLAFNLQSPSLFVDLRFPVDRPAHLSLRTSLADCSCEDLRYLARQHCFAGYSLPSDGGVYTRHHAIDWNFHPSFPRARPNKWRAEMNPDDHMSFKEFSTTLDLYQVPVYMERWQRFSGDSMGEQHFAAMRRRKLPSTAGPRDRGPLRKAILVLVGDHFAFALDRPRVPDFAGAPGPGGPALVDFAASTGDRVSAEAYLDLEGSYGQVRCSTSTSTSTSTSDSSTTGSKRGAWNISKSTHPWREEQCLFGVQGVAAARLLYDPGADDPVPAEQRQGQGQGQGAVPAAASLALQWGGYEWCVFENSYSSGQLREMFGGVVTVQTGSGVDGTHMIRSRL